MQIFVALSSIFLSYFCITAQADIQKEQLKCGDNKVEKMYPDIFFTFENPIESGSIEWIGKVYDTTSGLIFRLNRGFGNETNLEEYNSLSLEFLRTRMLFYSRNLEGRITGAEILEQNILTNFNYKTSIKILIHKDRYDIFVNGEKQWVYGRNADMGDILQSASLGGPFHPSKVILVCEENQTSEPEVVTTTIGNIEC